MKAALIRRHGPPEVLSVASLPEPVAGQGESLVDVTFAGLNYGDLHQRSGGPPPVPLPAVLGAEVVGTRRANGRRVAALLRGGGGYAQVAAVRDAHAIDLPEGLDDQQAAALLEQGATAYAALTAAGRLERGESVAVTAAAGGVGHLAVQLARALGAKVVVGTAGSPTKRDFVTTIGADTACDPRSPDVAGDLRSAAGGGIDLLIDTVGGALLRAALGALAPFGRVVSVGMRSQDHDQLSITEDLGVPTIGVFGFWMQHVVDRRALYERVATAVFDLALRGEVVARVDQVVSLADVGAAHTAMAAGHTMGKVLIDPRR